MPAQMGRAGLPLFSVAQKKERGASFHGSKAQPSAGGEIQRVGIAPDISDNAGNSPASERFFGNPKQLPHFGNTHDQKSAWIETER